MELTPLALEEIVGRLKAHEPFMLTRYGDGEWLAVLGEAPDFRWGPRPRENNPVYPGLPEAMRKALTEQKPGPDVYMTMHVDGNTITERRGMLPRVEAWLAENAPDLTWYDGALVFDDALEAGELFPFVEALRGLNVALIGPPHLERMVPLLEAEAHLEIPQVDAFAAYDEIRDMALNLSEMDVIAISAGIMSEVLVPDLWRKFGGNVTVIDVGSLWDLFCNAPSRSSHAYGKCHINRNMGLARAVSPAGESTVSSESNNEWMGGDFRSRCILVLCQPRSGSSAVAGVLYRLGVDMGGGMKRDALNPRGYYEDNRWKRPMECVAGRGHAFVVPERIPERVHKAFEKAAAECNRRPLWGIKSTRTVVVMPHLRRYFEDPRAVVVRRDKDAIVQSVLHHAKKAYSQEPTLAQAEQLVDAWGALRDQAAAVFPDEYRIDIQYEDLLANPEAEVRRLAEFVYRDFYADALDVQIRRAIQWLDPSLQHFS